MKDTARDTYVTLARFVDGVIPWSTMTAQDANRVKTAAAAALNEIDDLRGEVARLRELVPDPNR